MQARRRCGLHGSYVKHENNIHISSVLTLRQSLGYPLAPSQYIAVRQMNTIPKPQEMFTFWQTRRLLLNPAFQDDTTTLVDLFHSRKIAQAPLENVKSTIHNGLIELSWEYDNRKFSLKWDLAGKKVLLSP